MLSDIHSGIELGTDVRCLPLGTDTNVLCVCAMYVFIYYNESLIVLQWFYISSYMHVVSSTY